MSPRPEFVKMAKEIVDYWAHRNPPAAAYVHEFSSLLESVAAPLEEKAKKADAFVSLITSICDTHKPGDEWPSLGVVVCGECAEHARKVQIDIWQQINAEKDRRIRETDARFDRLAKCITETAALFEPLEESGVEHVKAELLTIQDEMYGAPAAQPGEAERLKVYVDRKIACPMCEERRIMVSDVYHERTNDCFRYEDEEPKP